jgi:hypothetical protein
VQGGVELSEMNGNKGWNSDIVADANLKVRWLIATTVLR